MPRLEFTTAIGYSVLGMLIVFVVLIALMYVVKIMERVFSAPAPAPSEPVSTADAPVSPSAAPAAPAPGTAGELKLFNVEEREAAMVMAVVAHKLGKPLNELRFISIREVTEE